MKHSLLLLLGVAFSLPAHAQTWQDVQSKRSGEVAQMQALSMQVPVHAKSRLLYVNTSDLRAKLNQAPVGFLTTPNTTISLPLPGGKFATYTLYNSPIMAKELALQNPDIQTFRIMDAQNPANTGRLDMSASGFHAMFVRDGKTIFVDPVGSDGHYQSYFKSDYISEMEGKNHSPINCLIHGRDHKEQKPNPQNANKPDVSYGVNLRTYRLAVAGTGEFTAFHGGTKASSLAAMVTGINRVNQVFETDLAIKLEIIANNSDVIYTNANTDPYTDNDPVALIGEIVTDLNAKIGIANYDIGHVFSTGGGGLAGLGVVCSSIKAEGVTGSRNPINDPFFIDFVAHEFGHQYGARHTFNGTAGACGGNRSISAAYEPGGGTTIMAYAGICADENIQNQGTDHYHNHSLGEITEFVTNGASGGSCGISTPLNNAVPVPNAGSDANIPASTPFILTGSATDANAGDTLSYIWEQYDLGGSTSSKATFTDDGTRPLFRSFSPSSSPSRIFPQINDILSGTITYGEILPTTNRDLNIRFTVRDGKGGVASDTVKLTVSNAAGPFSVTAPGSVTWSANSN
ncbi:MAG: hypothetical protein JKX72_11540 [Robiginitomaculum sp.]|nr:hypothetical protein [Robiginitomaculum sp.]